MDMIKFFLGIGIVAFSSYCGRLLAKKYRQRNSFLKQFKEFKLTIKSTYNIEAAQVGKGGISLNELNMFESKKIPGLFVCGEATDNVGICGGFNLWYAFTSGVYVADKLCK